MIDYAGNLIEFDGCSGCSYRDKKFSIPCGIAYENDRFILSQDWELPIAGFFVLSPKRCVDRLSDLTREEKYEMMDIIDKTILILRDNNVCDRYDVIFEEKENRHFHVWIMPRHKWMSDLVGDIIDNIDEVFSYAKSNLRNSDTFNKIDDVTKIVREEFNKSGD